MKARLVVLVIAAACAAGAASAQLRHAVTGHPPAATQALPNTGGWWDIEHSPQMVDAGPVLGLDGDSGGGWWDVERQQI